MLYAYRVENGHLVRMAPAEPLSAAIWIDLYAPQPSQVERVHELGIEVPSLEDMEEIEISNRLYREANADYMTVILPGQSPDKVQVSGPVTFILSPQRMVTVRHHAPRPFETFPERADRSSTGCASPQHLFAGLIEEIVSRQADLLESVGKVLDKLTGRIYGGNAVNDGGFLQGALETLGRESEAVGRVRLALLSVERAVSYFSLGSDVPGLGQGANGKLKPPVKALMRDIQALEVHCDFLSSRVATVTDATLGMINLAQNTTVRILSVVTALFLPPTLIASIYGMNFRVMPELDKGWGYPMALGMMLASAVLTYLFLRWKRWL